MDDKNVLGRLFAGGNSYWLTRFVILRLLGFVYAVAFLVAHCFVRLCQRGRSHDSLGDVHVDRPRRPNLVRLRLGNPAAGNRVFVDLSLPVARWPPVSEMPAAVARYLAFSLARFSHHDRRRLDQTARRPMLGRSHLPLLSLRNPANSESDQSLFAFRSALVSQIRDRLESLYRTGRAVVLVWSAHRAAYCGRLARQFSTCSDHQRQPLVSELCHHHSVSCLPRRHVSSSLSSGITR